MGHEAAINDFLDDFAHAWSTAGGSALGACFTEDASLINPFGERAEGRAAVATMYDEYFSTILRATTTRVKLDALRAVGGDHAFVDVDQTILGSDGETVMAVHLCALLRHEDEGWKFVDSRPYTVATIPA